ncbi:hypothetical protein ACFPJ4_08075 [Lysinimonas soli]|uniref:Septum formation-related domain-containing protein n=1 Tax=Lysinimonas soli TaxID=1074233 RepID=A0ABW0NTJ1_9MICO
MTERDPEHDPDAGAGPSPAEAPPAPGQPFSWGLTPGEPTQAITPEPEATQPMEQVEALPAAAPPAAATPTEPTHAQPTPAEAPPLEPTPAETTSAIDALFAETAFKEYDDALVPIASPAARPVAAGPAPAATGDHHGLTRAHKVLISIAVGLVAIVALIALFILGTRLPALLGSAPAAIPTASASPTPTPTTTSTVKPVGPVAVGVHRWDQLLGGECLDPFSSAWAETFTVVDCGAPHPAQMVFRGTFDPATYPTFPGADALQKQISLLCSAPGVLDLAAAGQYTDAQMQGSYPVTAQEWNAGQHDYFCFVNRSSGQPMTGSIAVAKTP